MREEEKKVGDERQGSSWSRGLLGSFPECTGEAELWEDVLFVFRPGDS